ncbi:MAG: GIY-YIG nuclease family protein [Bacteroidota bacterium]
MWYVYIIKSIGSEFRYIGFTGDLDLRLHSHNKKLNRSTKAYAPFELEVYIAVNSKKKAIALEKYFKTGSGKAVLKKRFLSDPD